MKKIIPGLIAILCISQLVSAQSAAIVPDGVLVPKITLTADLNSASPIISPAEGQLIFNTGANQKKGFYYWTGSAWQFLNPINAGTSSGQLLTWNGNNWVNTSPNPSTITALNNLQPYLAVNICIALQGIFPSRDGAEPYIGEITIYGFNFAPRGWAMCNGQLLSIAQNTALFSLLGTTYGGNGQTTFALPNLQGRVPIHFGQGAGLSPYFIGQQGGVESHIFNNRY
ncbi:tail fiber protein [Emticicia sp. BO119]|nr:tail fiber protein [Emticicia sp. BO119]